MLNRLSLLALGAFAALVAALMAGQPALVVAQQASSATPPPVRVEIYQQTNVRSGPGTMYDQVGVMIPGQVGEVLGRSPDSTWLKIVLIGAPDNSGWVFRDFVNLVGELPNIPTIEPPPTPTLPPTPTPEFLSTPSGVGTQVAANELPTYTAPAPVVRPTLLPVQGTREVVSFPPAVLIIVLVVLGTFGWMVSLMRRG
jgi:uncharacterized protein YraI